MSPDQAFKTTPLVDTCRSCEATISWALTDKGRRMPVDAPSDDGDLYCYDVVVRSINGQLPDATERHVTADAEKIPAGTPSVRVKSHFATCPNAGRHRRRRGDQ